MAIEAWSCPNQPIQTVLGIDIVPAVPPRSGVDACASQLIAHGAVVIPKLSIDQPELSTSGIELGRSVHIHDHFRRKSSTSARAPARRGSTPYIRVCSCGSRTSTLSHIEENWVPVLGPRAG
jgi:hypothetical protein